MELTVKIADIEYSANLHQGKSIAIALRPNGDQPNHFSAPACTQKTLVVGDFIGDTRRGGSCNVQQLTIVPHCNGTHTESVAHITDQVLPVHRALLNSVFPAVLISIEPKKVEANTLAHLSDRYDPGLLVTDQVILKHQLYACLEKYSDQQLAGLVIRTLPNESQKLSQCYHSNNMPPFFSNDAMQYIVDRKIQHLLVDLPSVDKMFDEGKLSNHSLFWNISAGEKRAKTDSMLNKTITEMIFVNEDIEDGFYLCNLRIPTIETDAVPSGPELYRLVNVNLHTSSKNTGD